MLIIGDFAITYCMHTLYSEKMTLSNNAKRCKTAEAFHSSWLTTKKHSAGSSRRLHVYKCYTLGTLKTNLSIRKELC